MRVTRYVTFYFVMGVAGVSAHGAGAAPTDPRVFSAWDQATIIGLSLVAALYAIGARRLARHGTEGSRVEHLAFMSGWLTLVVVVMPWFDAAVIERFSAHMAQHELMMLVGAPLLIAGRPLSTCLWAIPQPWRRLIAAPLQRGWWARAVRVLTTPAVAWAVHGAVLWIWHLPLLYNSAVHNEPVHAVQHAMFVGTALMFWSGLVYGRYGRAGYGVAVLFVFTTAIHTGLLGALITVSRMPIYSAYAGVPGFTSELAVADQQLAGLLMWIPAGLLLTLVAVALFSAWLGESERRSRATRHSLDFRARP